MWATIAPSKEALIEAKLPHSVDLRNLVHWVHPFGFHDIYPFLDKKESEYISDITLEDWCALKSRAGKE